MNDKQRGALTAAEQDCIEQKLDDIIKAQPHTFWASDVVDELATYIRTIGLSSARAFTTANAFVTARHEDYYFPDHEEPKQDRSEFCPRRPKDL